MSDFSSEWAQGVMAVGMDPFAVIQSYLDENVYPDLGQAFYGQTYAVMAFLVLIILFTAIGLYFRAKAGRFHLFLNDGALSRPDFKTCVPILWSIYSGMYIALTIIFVHGAKNKHHTTFTGRYTFTVEVPLVWSYACISLSTLVSAPPVRRWLIGLNEGAPVHRRWVPSMLLLNSTLLLVCVCATVGTIPPAIMLGQAFSEVHGVYDQASTALETAKSKGDLEIFNNLGGYLLEFDRSSNKNGNATKMGHSIYLSYVIFFFVTGILPAVFLHREINRKINRLENDQTNSTSRSADAHTTRHHPNAANNQFTTTIRLKDMSPTTAEHEHKPYVPELPADRPFANFATAPTGVVPPQFQAIIDEQSSPREKARRLRAALRLDARMVGAYALLLMSFLGMTAFFAAKGRSILSAKQDYIIGYSFPAWNFIVPGSIVAITFLYEAVTHKTLDDEDEVVAERALKSPSRKFNAPPIAAVQVAQSVDIVYTEERKADKFVEDDDDERRSIGPRSLYVV